MKVAFRTRMSILLAKSRSMAVKTSPTEARDVMSATMPESLGGVSGVLEAR